jgi:hypothetical protein
MVTKNGHEFGGVLFPQPVAEPLRRFVAVHHPRAGKHQERKTKALNDSGMIDADIGGSRVHRSASSACRVTRLAPAGKPFAYRRKETGIVRNVTISVFVAIGARLSAS